MSEHTSKAKAGEVIIDHEVVKHQANNGEHGSVLVGADFTALEERVLAHYKPEDYDLSIAGKTVKGHSQGKRIYPKLKWAISEGSFISAETYSEYVQQTQRHISEETKLAYYRAIYSTTPEPIKLTHEQYAQWLRDQGVDAVATQEELPSREEDQGST